MDTERIKALRAITKNASHRFSDWRDSYAALCDAILSGPKQEQDQYTLLINQMHELKLPKNMANQYLFSHCYRDGIQRCIDLLKRQDNKKPRPRMKHDQG